MRRLLVSLVAITVLNESSLTLRTQTEAKGGHPGHVLPLESTGFAQFDGTAPEAARQRTSTTAPRQYPRTGTSLRRCHGSDRGCPDCVSSAPGLFVAGLLDAGRNGTRTSDRAHTLVRLAQRRRTSQTEPCEICEPTMPCQPMNRRSATPARTGHLPESPKPTGLAVPTIGWSGWISHCLSCVIHAPSVDLNA